MVGGLIDRLFGWLVSRSLGLLVGWSLATGWLVGQLATGWFVDWLVGWMHVCLIYIFCPC